jgi:hypothetical protein
MYLTGFFGHHNLSGSASFDDILLESYGGRDIFISKISADGKVLWASQAGSPLIGGNDIGGSIQSNPSGECYVSGLFEQVAKFDDILLQSHGKRDGFLAKYDQTGKVLWATNFGGAESDNCNSLCVDRKGNVYCTGVFTGSAKFDEQELTSSGEEDIFIVKYSPDGDFVWLRQLGGDSPEWNSDSASEIAINPDGHLVVTGFFSGTMQIGTQTLTSAGREDIFILFFDQDGSLLDAKQMVYQL